MAGKKGNNKATTSGNTSTLQEEKDETFSLKQMREILKVQDETIISFFNTTIERLENKIEILKKTHEEEIADLKKSIEFNGKDITKINDALKHEIQALTDDRKDFAYYVNERLAGQEDRDRRNNLRFDNIPEAEDGKESWEDCERKVKKAINNLGIDTAHVKIERAHRVGGKRITGKRRGILAKFSFYKEKEEILKEYRRQKHWEKRDTYINEDFSDFITALRKRLFVEAKALREKGEYAKVVYNRIIRHNRQIDEKLIN